MTDPSVPEDIRRMWNADEREDADLTEDAYVLLDRATTQRRAERAGPLWAEARLGEGLARLLVARQMADWGNRSYALQALEASIDGLRDAVAHLPEHYDPRPDDVAAFRQRLLLEWRAAQSEPGLERIARLNIPALRDG